MGPMEGLKISLRFYYLAEKESKISVKFIDTKPKGYQLCCYLNPLPYGTDVLVSGQSSLAEALPVEESPLAK